MKVAINGFGRIGRVFMRVFLERKRQKFDVVVINHSHGAENAAYLLKHDTMLGMLDHDIKVKGDFLIVKKKKIRVISEKDVSKISWKKFGVDTVLDCSGKYKIRSEAQKHIKAGAKRVVISSPSKDFDTAVVLGVNDSSLDTKSSFITNCSCTTNCLTPLVKILNEQFGIQRAFFNTIHAYTNDQRLQDSFHPKNRRGRAAAQNIVPTTSGASTSVVQVLPEMKGKINGLAIRVPIATGSIVDLTAELKKDFSVEQINAAFRKAAKTKQLKGILEYSSDDLVSSDIIGNSASCIFDSKSTMKDGNLVKILAWYDNEYGYSSRLVDIISKLS